MTPPTSGTSALATARARGFTLLEVLVAFAILAGTLSLLAQVNFAAVQTGTNAVNLRDVRVAGDTVFRRLIYELDQHEDGESYGLDRWYGEWLWTGAKRDRWAIYRGVFHKTRAVAAGTDPTGRDPSVIDPVASGSSTRGTTTPPPSSSSSSSGTSGTGSATTGEEVYMLSFDVYLAADLEAGEETPVLTLRTIVPLPPNDPDAQK